MNRPLLIVDDDRVAREALRLRLTHAGFHTVTAGDAATAIEKYQLLNPRVVFLDISMPGLNGFEVCRYIKEEEGREDVSVVFISGASSPTLDYVSNVARKSAEVITSSPSHMTEKGW